MRGKVSCHSRQPVQEIRNIQIETEAGQMEEGKEGGREREEGEGERKKEPLLKFHTALEIKATPTAASCR